MISSGDAKSIALTSVSTSCWSLPLYGSSCWGEGNFCCRYFSEWVGEEPISFTAKPKRGENSSAKGR